MSSTLIHTPLCKLQPDDLHCCFSAPVEKDCILCKQGEISGLVTDTKAQVVSFVSCAAAAFAATSALAFPVDIKLLSLVCAAHLQIATLSGKRMASKSLATRDAFNIGCPSDFKKFLCFQSAPKSCVTPKSITRVCVNCHTLVCHKITRFCQSNQFSCLSRII